MKRQVKVADQSSYRSLDRRHKAILGNPTRPAIPKANEMEVAHTRCDVQHQPPQPPCLFCVCVPALKCTPQHRLPEVLDNRSIYGPAADSFDLVCLERTKRGCHVIYLDRSNHLADDSALLRAN